MTRIAATSVAFVVTAASAFAQAPPPPSEGGGEPASTLMFFTLGTALVLGVGGLLWFLRKRSNRAAADRALNPSNPENR